MMVLTSITDGSLRRLLPFGSAPRQGTASSRKCNKKWPTNVSAEPNLSPCKLLRNRRRKRFEESHPRDALIVPIEGQRPFST
jgi:hypothetical protein